MLPESIRGDTGRQWIRPIHDPMGQIQAVAFRGAGREPWQNGRSVRHYLFALTKEIAANVKVGFAPAGSNSLSDAAGHLQIMVVGLVEECVQLVVIVMRQRVLFMRVAFAATHGQSQPRRPRRVGAILGGLDAKLFDIRVVVQAVPQETGRDTLLGGGAGSEIAGQLFDGELIEGQIAVKRIDHPIAMTPCMRPMPVVSVSVAIRVTCHIQLVPAPTFAKVRRGQQTIDQSLIGIRPRVAVKSLNFCEAGR